MGVFVKMAFVLTILFSPLLMMGCAPDEVEEQPKETRYEVEYDRYYGSLCIYTVTDTETGRQWLILTTSGGGIDIEPIGGGADD